MRNLPHRLDVFTQKKVANRIFTGLVLGGLLVASGLLLQYRPRLGTIGFLIAGALGLYMVVTILISDRRSKRWKGKS